MKFVSTAAIAILLSVNSYAMPAEKFEESRFLNLISSGQPFVVAFHSGSCGSCKIQKPNLESVLKDNALKDVPGLMANFEETKTFRDALEKSVRGPSTILIFKDGKEVGRILGETDKEKIKAQIIEKI